MAAASLAAAPAIPPAALRSRCRCTRQAPPAAALVSPRKRRRRRGALRLLDRLSAAADGPKTADDGWAPFAHQAARCATEMPSAATIEPIAAAAGAAKGKVLICCSSVDHVDLQSCKQQPMGFFLKELGRPLVRLLDSNYHVVFANPKGNAPSMDPLSDSMLWFNPWHWSEKDEEVQLLERLHAKGNLDQPRTFASISDEELESFDGVLIPGGRILLHFHKRSKPTGMICHAPIALLSTKQVELNAPWAYVEYKMTCYSDAEENMIELLWLGKLPYKVESELRENGGILVEALPMMPKVTIDRELISAQGPTSADQFGAEYVEQLNKQRQD
eukprot:SM000026S08919  [mRNA]  locus=s26:416712:418989:- [translate_table: standard]